MRENLRVLVVDDDPFQLDVIAELLRSLSIRDVTLAEGSTEALQALAKARTPYDLLLTDLLMPGADGFQFMGSVAQNGFAGALIIVSGQSSEVIHSAGLVAQLRRFNLLGTIAKPVERASLLHLISALA
jgi:CheY-like chemotaxis protein